MFDLPKILACLFYDLMHVCAGFLIEVFFPELCCWGLDVDGIFGHLVLGMVFLLAFQVLMHPESLALSLEHCLAYQRAIRARHLRREARNRFFTFGNLGSEKHAFDLLIKTIHFKI